jgi:hypothetical protein
MLGEMRGGAAWMVSVAAIAACSATHPLAGPDATDAADAGAPDAASSEACGPPMELLPCRTDSDCRSAYLVCVPPDYATVTLCVEPDASLEPDCPDAPVFPELSTAPLCPREVQVTSPVCEVRWQRPCAADSDCGPAGFVCTDGRCRHDAAPACTTASDCPAEWLCSAPCACPGTQVTTTCQPPFAIYRCPACAPVRD